MLGAACRGLLLAALHGGLMLYRTALSLMDRDDNMVRLRADCPRLPIARPCGLTSPRLGRRARRHVLMRGDPMDLSRRDLFDRALLGCYMSSRGAVTGTVGLALSARANGPSDDVH